MFYSLSFLEWMIPLTIVYTLIILIIIYKIKIIENKTLDKIVRLLFGIILVLLFLSHYFLTWTSIGLDVNHLPLQFYSFTTIICLLLIITKKRIFFSIALTLGILGGMINIMSNQVGYSYQFFRYYQFMISNGLFIIIPIYFLIIHDYYPTFKEMIKSISIIQMGIILIFLINLLLKTQYMYLTIGENVAREGSIMSLLGEWPWYIIWFELIGLISIILIYGIILLFKREKERKDVEISQYSIYMTQKKKK